VSRKPITFLFCDKQLFYQTMESNIRINTHLTALLEYCENHSSPQSDILYQLERETHLKTLAPQMMSGHLQGRFFAMLSKIKQPRAILEVGTFTGYAALCLAEGLPEEGVLHTIEVNPELEYLIRKYIHKAGREDQIRLHIGDAAEVIPGLNLSFDMAFIDAGKMDYAHHYELVVEKMKPGGIILADNVLWSGKVAEKKFDKDTAGIRAFNEQIQLDEQVENILLPIRDGIMLMIKK
jgi:predicted O-methyltransferase YrrM